MKDDILPIDPVGAPSKRAQAEKLIAAYLKEMERAPLWAGTMIPPSLQSRLVEMLSHEPEVALRNIRELREAHNAASLDHHLRRVRIAQSHRRMANIQRIC